MRLNKLCGSIVVRDVEPQSMRNSCWSTLTHAERVATDEICTFSVWIIQCVEEVWSGWAQEVLDVLLKCIDILARWVFGNLHIIRKYFST